MLAKAPCGRDGHEPASFHDRPIGVPFLFVTEKKGVFDAQGILVKAVQNAFHVFSGGQVKEQAPADDVMNERAAPGLLRLQSFDRPAPTGLVAVPFRLLIVST